MSRKLGGIAEEKATRFLQAQGFKILDRNFTIRGGEIDIIALKDATLHFVEVKSGANFEPVYNITSTKLERITKTAHTYIKAKSFDMPFCIDAIIIKQDLEFLENITI